jgi:hypothetical protein
VLALDKIAPSADVNQLVAKAGVSRTLPFDTWIDGPGRVRRLPVTVALARAGHSSRIDVQLDLFDFGPTPAVTPPPERDVVDVRSPTARVEFGRPAPPPARRPRRPFPSRSWLGTPLTPAEVAFGHAYDRLKPKIVRTVNAIADTIAADERHGASFARIAEQFYELALAWRHAALPLFRLYAPDNEADDLAQAQAAASQMLVKLVDIEEGAVSRDGRATRRGSLQLIAAGVQLKSALTNLNTRLGV